ncbi:MAG: lipopolysaccharide heptosyltransferase II [Deltaproteobacteria bacterium]|nr:lipopolysaccharide heptosyltransferase II [Deltaproteobacteria bacterium]
MKFKKILIVKIAAIGDILMTTPAIRALKKTFPDSKIIWLAGSSVKEAIERNPYVDEIIEIDDRLFFKGTPLEKALTAARLIKRLKKERFDAALVLHRDWKYGLITRLCGIIERPGLGRSFVSRLLLTDAVSFDAPVHHIYHYLEAAKRIGAKEDGVQMDFAVRTSVRDKVLKELKAARFKPNKLIGIAPGGARNIKEVMDSRRWPALKYRELVSLLAKGGFNVLLLGSKSDKWFLEGWRLPDGVIDLIGRTTIEETAACMGFCKAVVANDSGPMHLASALRRPVISIFGPTDPREKYPLSEGSFYFWKANEINCAPCYSHGAFPECKTLDCMERVSVEEVYKKVIEIAEGVLPGGPV